MREGSIGVVVFVRGVFLSFGSSDREEGESTVRLWVRLVSLYGKCVVFDGESRVPDGVVEPGEVSMSHSRISSSLCMRQGFVVDSPRCIDSGEIQMRQGVVRVNVQASLEFFDASVDISEL